MKNSRLQFDLIFIGLVILIWALAMGGRWGLFAENWWMSVTMAFGSFVAGSTSQGGGAVAFPVMTLGFDVQPQVARDFSLMIQSVGMSSASALILWRRIKVEKTALFVAGSAGVLGMILGLETVAPLVSPNPTKIFFVSLWLAFGVALWRINHLRRPVVREVLPNQSVQSIAALAIAGMIGGVISSLLGSGLDILVFALLVLGFRVCETVATPTSVILMAINSLAGFFWRGFEFGSQEPIELQTWDYWWCCVPIVAIGAPLGAEFISKRGRGFVVKLLLTIIFAQFITALIVVPFDLALTILALTTFFVGAAAFWRLWIWGRG